MDKIIKTLTGFISAIASLIMSITKIINIKPSNSADNNVFPIGLHHIIYVILILFSGIFIFFIIKQFVQKQPSASPENVQPITPKIEGPASEFSEDFIKAIKRSGIKSLHWGSDFDKLTDKLSEEDVKNVDMLVYHGSHFYDYIYTPIRTILKKSGTNVRLLVSQFDSPFMNEVWEMEEKCKRKHGGNIDSSRKKQKEVLKEIDKFKKEIDRKYSSDKLQIRIYNTQIRYALILVDYEWAWWTPYHPGIIVEQTTSFVLEGKGEKDKDAILSQCNIHYETLWENSMSWKLPDFDNDNERSEE